MGVAASIAVEERSVQERMARPSRFGDKAFEWLTLAMALAVVVLIILIGWQLWIGSSVAIKKFGFHFLTTSTWDPVAEQFGALPFIYGTLVSSLIALVIAVPLGIATAAYLTELAPLWIRQPLASLIEMLAAIPSVILGLWGIFVMIPWLRDYPFPWLKRSFGWTPFFSGPIYGPCMFAGGSIIAGPGFATRSCVRFGRDALGSYPHRGPELREERVIRCGDSRAGPRSWRNDGCHHGDRQYASDRRVAFQTRLYPGQCARQ